MTDEELKQFIQKAARQKWTKFDLSDSQISQIPPEIGQLTNLRILNLSSNRIRKLPLEIAQLTSLSRLDLSHNQISEIPSEIGQLTNLSYLHLSNNLISQTPPEIGRLTNLSYLHLISQIPSEIKKLTNLRKLNFRGNPLPVPPEIIEKVYEPASLLNYYFSLQQAVEKRPLNEVKMILVGQGSVGKTSLVKRLENNTYNPQENKTEGINIRKWSAIIDDQTIQVNIWDFGGQEIMHATHQFFLTKHSLYLLVLDARQGEEENRLEYWLKIINSFSDNSPILIVGNKSDQHPLDLDRRGLQEKYPNIQGFIETSCKTCDGIDELKQNIIQEIKKLKHVRDDLLPLNWLKLKEKLESLDKNYISYSEYEILCKQEKITDLQSQKTLIGYLHDLGIVLNFSDDPRLTDTHVLNPEWVTNGVYKIINDRSLIIDSQGVLDCNELICILEPLQYPTNKHFFIIDMMKKFELCFQMEEEKTYLIPDIIPKKEPYTGDWTRCLYFQYHYPVLPNSVISRFIVRMNQYISKKTYWRNGVVLAYKNERNVALIKADREEKKIFIAIQGQEATRRSFLSIIRFQFDHIHKSLPGIEVQEKVALKDRPDIVIDYNYLLELESLGEMSFIPQGLKERVNIKKLLDGFESESDRSNRSISKSNPNINININNQPDMSNFKQSNSGGDDNVGRDKTSTTNSQPSSSESTDRNTDAANKNTIVAILATIVAMIGLGWGMLTYFFNVSPKNPSTPAPSATVAPKK